MACCSATHHNDDMSASVQAATTLSTDNVMMSSLRAFASDVPGASVSPPANAGGGAPAASLGSSVGIAYLNGTEVAADVAVDTQVQQLPFAHAPTQTL